MQTLKLRNKIPLNFPWCIGVKPKKGKSVSVTHPTMGTEMVMYTSDNGKVYLMSDVCPHRGARFSNGDVVNGCVRCPYHGWEFSSEGKLTYVPSSFQWPESSIRTYKAEVQGDFVWLPGSGYEIPKMPTDMKKHVSGTTLVEGNWIDWIMNASDISHINFVHDFADEMNGGIKEIKVTEDHKRVCVNAKVNSKSTSLITKHMETSDCPISSVMYLPNTTEIRITLKGGNYFTTFTTVTPVSKTKSRITWYFGYDMDVYNGVGNALIADQFRYEMKKTVREDERVIKSLNNMTTYNLSSDADAFQLKVIERLHKLYSENEINLTSMQDVTTSC